MRLAYYPGCSLEGISSEYDHSIRKLFEVLEVPYEELPDWICCGTVAAPALSHLMGIATPLYNIAHSKDAGFDSLITPCSACLYHFKKAAKHVHDDPELRGKIEQILELPLDDLPPAIHPLELLSDETYFSRIRDLKSDRWDLSGLKVVCYYGCHITRPAELMQFDDPENPQSMERLLELVGVTILDWSGKVDCCGAHFSLIKPDIVVDLAVKLISAAQDSGADVIVVACPMCHANLDTRQDAVRKKMNSDIDMPILYFSQVLGFGMGIDPKDLAMTKHIVNPIPTLLSRCEVCAG